MLQGSDALWEKVLAARYGNLKHIISSPGVRTEFKSRLVWWYDCLNFESKFSTPIFSDNCEFILGDRNAIPFWSTKWLNVGRLLDIFPSLFKASVVKGGNFNSMGVRIDTVWFWGNSGIGSSNPILLEELLALRGLLAMVAPSAPFASGSDQLVLLKDKEKSYSTNSSYLTLLGFCVGGFGLEHQDENLEMFMRR